MSSSSDFPFTPSQHHKTATMTSQITNTSDSTNSTSNNSNSNSDPSSDESSSPPTTPESPESSDSQQDKKRLTKQAEATAKTKKQTRRLQSHTQDEERTRFPELHGPTPLEAAHHSSRPTRSALRNGKPRRSLASRKLGAISETTDDIAPDIPTRNPRRVHFANLGNFTAGISAAAAAKARYYADHRNLFAWATKKGRGDDIEDDPKVYEKIVGPSGEKFSDVRANAVLPDRPAQRRKQTYICCGILLALILVIALAIGLGIGLTHHKAKQGATIPLAPNSSETLPFPLGTWQIPTYLTATATACTAVSSAWACYPYTTYDTSSTASYSPLVWAITSPKNTTLDLVISATNPQFSYSFASVPLIQVNADDPAESAFWFNTTFRKEVIPTTSLTSDGTTSRCYYDNTGLSVKLYSTAQGGGNVKGNMPNSTVSGEGIVNQWPYAVEYFESIAEQPTCYQFVGGQDGPSVPVQQLNGNVGLCSCSYTNFNL